MQTVREHTSHSKYNKTNGIKEKSRCKNLEKHEVTSLNNTGQTRNKRLKIFRKSKLIFTRSLPLVLQASEICE